MSQREAIFDCLPNLLVRDLAAGLRFHEGALGFRVGWRWSDRRAGFLREDEPGERGTALVGRDRAQIVLTEVDGLFEEWRARGVGIDEPPTARPWGTYEMRLRDPDGNVLRVSSPPG